MGMASSKSPLERRNTVARRSQRRTLHNQKTKVDQLLKDIKKFKGATEDVDYVALKNEINYLKNDLVRRGKDLQPEVRNLYENVHKKICEAEDTLENKLQENKNKTQIKPNENVGISQSVADDHTEVLSEVSNAVDDNRTIAEIHDENKEINDLTNSDDKRRTVELKLVKVLAEGSPKSAKEVRIVSPEEKRRSVLKVGVPVMPGVGMNELNAHTTRITRQYGRGTATSSEGSSVPAYVTVQEVQLRINSIVDNLRQIEFEINEFIGKKNSRQYIRIRDTLNRILIELNSLAPLDEYILEQVSVCKNYVGSCLNFLNERAIDDDNKRESFTSDDEVWENNNAVTKVEGDLKIQKLLKNTAV